MNQLTPKLLTASQIAGVINRPRPSVSRELAKIQPTGQNLVRGALANAWSLEALPEGIREELVRTAKAAGSRDVFELVERSDSGRALRWEPPIQMKDIPKKYIERAIKLQQALSKTFGRLNDQNLTESEIDSLGVSDYKGVFGYEISARHFRRLLDRTLSRDKGFEEWHRVDLYLDEIACDTTPARARSSNDSRFDLSTIHEVIESLDNKDKLTSDERAYLFHSAFSKFEILLAQTAHKSEQRALKSAIIDMLILSAPGISKSPKALRRVFEINLVQWRANGRKPSALADHRHLTSGNFRTPDFSADKEKITKLAIQHGGKESLAHRILRKTGELSQEFTDYYPFDPRSDKSAVPKTIRKDITPKVDMCGPIHRGPWEAKMRGPYIPRDWSDVLPGQYYSADDVTWNNYTYWFDEDGKLNIKRPECLVFVDLRTTYPLASDLILGKYNSRHIRSLCTRVHDSHGLPREGFYFERSVWASRLIDGDTTKDSLKFRETEAGLRERGLNLEVRHAHTPRAKPIERMFGIIQEVQRAQPGFCGFNERTEKMERLQEFIRRAMSGKEHPGNELLEIDQWNKLLSKTLKDYAHEPQNGKMLPGKSPAEAWEEEIQNRPLQKLPADARYILATHRKTVRVKQEGIVLQIPSGAPKRLYCNDHTGELIGQEVLVYYNIDFPELLTVSDLNRQNFFSVKQISLPAMKATKEQRALVHQQIAGHMKPAKVLHDTISHRIVSTVTYDSKFDDDTKTLGRFHNAEEKAAKEEKSASARDLKRIQTQVATGGGTVNLNVRNTERVLEGLEWEKEIRARLAKTSTNKLSPETSSNEP